MPRDYHELPPEAYMPVTEALPADFAFNSSEPPPDPDFKEAGGRFVKGFDPKRHTFTREECSEGCWAGLASYVERGGEARNFLRRKMSARGQAFTATPKGDRGRLAKAA